MQSQHPDDRFPLTQHERDEFNRICQELAGGVPQPRPRADAGEPVRLHPAWSGVAMVCTVLVFIGLAVNSVFLVVFAAAGAVGPHLARRLPRSG